MKIVAFLTSTLYAIALTTPRGIRWTQRQTWATVVAGTMMTLFFLYLEDDEAAEKAKEYFIATGIPIITRSLILQMIDLEQAGL